MTKIDAHDISMDEMLDLVVEEGASDLHLAVGVPPVLRIHGSLHPLDAEPLERDDTDRLMKAISSDEHQRKLREVGGSDFGISFGDKARFRVSIFKQKGSVGIVLRQIPNKMFSLEEIGLPPQVKDLLFKPRGLFLVTGPTGSGKSTTLASMIHHINLQRDCHIITVEDPTEYYHNHEKSIISQREVGVDVPNFAAAVRAGLRMDPDVILVGEMRDLETIEAAITAAETGHLVFGTLHTTGSARTVDRIIDAFPANQQAMIRTQLSANLMAVVSQLLMVRQDKPGRIAAFEYMVATPSIRALIRDNKTFRITSELQTGGKWGMITLDWHLIELFQRGLISYEDVISKSQDTETVVQKLQSLGLQRG